MKRTIAILLIPLKIFIYPIYLVTYFLWVHDKAVQGQKIPRDFFIDMQIAYFTEFPFNNV